MRAPALLKASIDFYAKVDARITPLASELLDLLGKVGKPKELGALAPPPKPATAEQELARVNPKEALVGFDVALDHLLDPSTMRGPAQLICPTATAPAGAAPPAPPPQAAPGRRPP